MAKFRPGEPIESDKSVISVDNELKEDKHRFQLVVENDRGERSDPAVIVVTIVDRAPD